MKYIICILVLCFSPIFNVIGQTYNLKSFEGKDAKINLYYKPSSGVLRISHMKDTILVNDYMSIDTVEIVNNFFMKIQYAKRAGSNLDIINQLMLFIKKGKLCQALHINSARTYDLRPNEYIDYHLSLIPCFNSKYGLIAKVHNEKFSNLSTKKLNYDTTININCNLNIGFYFTNYENLQGSYKIYNFNKNPKQRYFNRHIPIISLGGEKYYYLDNNWYSISAHNLYSMLL